MGIFGEFQNKEHKQRFLETRAFYARGGPMANYCEAKTKSGSLCRNAPISGGNGRCLLHCGRVVARLVRDRQLADFGAGRISLEEWQRLEGKRIKNRVQYNWSKNPWLPGKTITLGDHEQAFRLRCAEAGVRTTKLAPAVLDWLGWKYRRLMVDRTDERRWHGVVQTELPVRVHKAGPAPDGWTWTRTEDFNSIPEATHKVIGSGKTRKRSLPDKARITKPTPLVRFSRSGRPLKNTVRQASESELWDTFERNRKMLNSLFEKCFSEEERRLVLQTLHGLETRPNDGAAQNCWYKMVETLINRRG